MSILTAPPPSPGYEPESLMELEGIGPKLAYRIERHYHEAFKEWQKYGEKDHIFTHLRNRDNLEALPPGDTTILNCVKADPYELRHVRGINFKRADSIAIQNYRIHPDDERRHTAGNQSIVEAVGAAPMWKYRKDREKLLLRNAEHELAGVTVDHGLVWLPVELTAERKLAELFEDALTSNEQHELPDLTGFNVGELNTDQELAVRTALSGVRVMALTGSAGTGKTRATAAIAKAAKALPHLHKRVRVMAFAGKAAMRSAEAMREDGVDWVECSTIHRALGLKGQYAHGNPIDEQIIILDEASMIPNWLMAAVIRNMKPNATLILVGDPNQLPPIGHGTPFQDYLALDLPHVHLEQNYRQAGQVSIHEFAEAIRNQNPNLWTPTVNGVNARFNIDPSDAEADFDKEIRKANEMSLHDWQLVTWKNDTRHALNDHVQQLLNPNGETLFDYRLWAFKDEYGRYKNAEVCVGDKVLITDNDYNYGIFNGQTGIITNYQHRQIEIDFGLDEPTLIDLEDARDLMQLGYCVTVHKAQGSGWESVLLYQPEPVKFSPRRFYYTSVTRAKNAVHVFTTLTARDFWKNVQQADNDPDSTLIQRVYEAR